jgi:hypothetical protein
MSRKDTERQNEAMLPKAFAPCEADLLLDVFELTCSDQRFNNELSPSIVSMRHALRDK